MLHGDVGMTDEGSSGACFVGATVTLYGAYARWWNRLGGWSSLVELGHAP
jgi:hypothetical protein